MATWAPIDPRLRLAKTIEKTKKKQKNNIPGAILAKTLEKTKKRNKKNNTFVQIERPETLRLQQDGLMGPSDLYESIVFFVFFWFSPGFLLVNPRGYWFFLVFLVSQLFLLV